jgi:hypothetical protein
MGAAKRVGAASAEVVLAHAPSLDLEPRGLTTVSYGGVVLGVAGIDTKDTTALRLRLYLYNPSEQPVRVGLPGEDALVLVDARGRRVTSLGDPRTGRVQKEGGAVVVPALERVKIAMLYTNVPGDGGEALLKVGTSGIIRGIPLRVDPAPGAVPTAAPSAPPPMPNATPSATPSATPNGAPNATPNGAPNAPAPAPLPDEPAAATTASIAGEWHEPDTFAAIRLNPDGSYTAPDGGVGTFRVVGGDVLFTGPLSAWNGGRAVLKPGAIEFRWKDADADGVEHRFRFVRK